MTDLDGVLTLFSFQGRLVPQSNNKKNIPRLCKCLFGTIGQH